MYEKIPIPPVLDHQCDTLIIGIMKAHGTDLLKLLWRAVCEKKRAAWFEIFLTIFTLNNNIEYVYGIQKEWAQMYSGTTVSLSLTALALCRTHANERYRSRN